MEQSADAETVRAALLRQWDRIGSVIGSVDLGAASRVAGWRNREVVAHLAVQPPLLARFLGTASGVRAEISLAANLSGTESLAQMIDDSVRNATDDDLDFTGRLRRVRPVLESADLAATVTTLQGPIALVDYLRTRCVEAVVHGCDLTPPVVPDPEALAITARALLDVLEARHPALVAVADALPALDWVDQATGRRPPSPQLSEALPVMK